MMRRWRFNLWYYLKPGWDTGISPPELLAFIQTHPPGRALDLGCGTGTNVITLARHGWQVTGLDFAGRAIRTARQKAQAAGVQVELRVADVSDRRELTGAYDLILDMGCFHSLSPEKRAAYRENIKHRLRPGGAYLLYTFLKSEPAGPEIGLSEAEVAEFGHFLNLRSRQDSHDQAAGRRSTWLFFERS